MKLVISLALAVLGALSSSFTAPESTTASLLDAAVQRYLQEMKAAHHWTPSVFIIETENKTTFSQLREQYGPTQIMVKTPQEVKEYSIHHLGKTMGFYNVDVEREAEAYNVYVVAENIRTTMKDGAPIHTYEAVQQGAACTLSFNAQLRYQGIDCLVYSEESPH